MLVSYPSLRSLNHFYELSVITSTIAVDHESEVVCFLLPVELLLLGIRVLSRGQARKRKGEHVG